MLLLQRTGETAMVILGRDAAPNKCHFLGMACALRMDGAGYCAAAVNPLKPGRPGGGAWLSLVERLLWEQDVGGSNPLAPTTTAGTLARRR